MYTCALLIQLPMPALYLSISLYPSVPLVWFSCAEDLSPAEFIRDGFHEEPAEATTQNWSRDGEQGTEQSRYGFF